MRTSLFLLIHFFIINAFLAVCYAGTPMVIDINEGIEEVPFETGDVDKEVTSSFVQTITASDIQNTKTDLAQVIEKYSGIDIRQVAGIGSFSLVSIRGKSADQTKVYVDGILLNDASGGGVDLSLIPLNEIGSIEIYKDIVPIEFAEASNGGVINIITRRASTDSSLTANSTTLSQMIGSFDTYKTDFHGQFNKNKWQYTVSGGQLKSKNNYPYLNENGTFQNKADDTKELRQNDQLEQYNVIAKAKHNISNTQHIIYQAEFFDKNKGLPSINNNPFADTSLRTTNQNAKAKYTNKKLLTSNIELNINTAFNKQKIVYDDRKNGFGLTPDYMKYDTDGFDSQLYLKLKRDNFNITSNSTLGYERLVVTDLLGDSIGRQNIRKNAIFGLEANLFYVNRKIVISPAVRYQIIQDEIDGLSISGSGVKSVDNSNYKVATPQLGIRYTPTPDTSFKFNIASYYRLPSYIELFGGRGYIGANEDLQPEKGINTDFGFELSYFPHSKTYTMLSWKSAIFYSRINNEIIYTFNSRGEGRPENTGNSIIKGIENQFLIELFYNFEISSNSTFLLPYNYTDSNRRRVLPGRPLVSFSNKITYHYKSSQFYLENLQEKYMYYDSEERLPASDKNDLNFGYRLSLKKLSFSFLMNNMLDTRYKSYFFQTSPGRSIQFSTSYKFS